ncbi:MAG: geranylgeranyl reductase family protein [Vulcanisaeta sp.]|nr:geranylgeranyl reductase family protein [Vulcanisaeta sp.]
MASTYDVVVIGAGPAGSVSAYVASRLGLRVLVIDRFRFPRVKPCGGGLTQKSVALLQGLGIDPEPIVRNYCSKVVVVNHAGSFILMDRKPIISIVSRDEFDNYLLSRALDEGADYVVDRVVGIKRGGDVIEVVGFNNTYVGRYVIASDGANSIIAKIMGNNVRSNTALAYMTIARGKYRDDVCVIDMTRAKWGYSWVFPRGGGEYDVGVGSIHWGNYRQQLINYVNGLGLREGAILGHPIPIRRRKVLTIKRVVLTGDAGGFADPTTGEGIFYAMYTGALAALALRKSSNPADFSDMYLNLVRPLIRNLSVAYYVSLGTYGIDNLVMGRLGMSAFLIDGTAMLINNVMSGRVWYSQVIKSIIKSSLGKGLRVIVRRMVRF